MTSFRKAAFLKGKWRGKVICGKKKMRVRKREEEGRGKEEGKQTKLLLCSNIIYRGLSKQKKNVAMTDDWYKRVKQG